MDGNELKRFKWNSWAFIISYIFMGLLSGVAFDVLVTFLQQVSVDTAKSFSSYMGYSTFLGAIMLLAAPKIGYKKLIITGPVMVVAALVAIPYVNVNMIYPVATLFVLTGVTLFDIILPPYLTAYTTAENRQFTFSTAIWTNVAGMAAATFFGGSLIVNRFASRIGVDKIKASALTEQVDKLSPAMAHQYILAQSDVLLMFAVVAAISLIPLLFIKEVSSDYREEIKGKHEKKKFDWSIFANKYVVYWLVYYALIRFGASLVCPYFSVYLNKFIGINRATTSMLVSFQQVAMVLFMIASPIISKKFGNVIALGGLGLLSIPFMIFIANGKAFGGGAVVVVGLALFMRSGLMNAANPIMNSLPMEFVSKDLRPAYNSAIFIAGSLTAIVAGYFTKGFLFKLNGGYSIAYYITGVIYTIASVLLIVVYKKKYNRSHEDSETEEEVVA